MIVETLFFLKELLTKTEISNFEGIVMCKYVIRLYISMYNVMLVEIFEAVNELFEIKKYIFFSV